MPFFITTNMRLRRIRVYNPAQTRMAKRLWRECVSSLARPCIRLDIVFSTLFVQFANSTTGAEGFIARDDVKREFVVAFAGRYVEGRSSIM